MLTTVVGSYPIPDWLPSAHTEQALRDAAAVAIKAQELAGIDVITNGEIERFDFDHPESNGMIEYVLRRIAGVRSALGRKDELQFRQLAHMGFRTRPAGIVERQLGDGTLNLPADYRRARVLTCGKLKFTLASPYMLARTLLDTHYKSLQELTLAMADVLAGQVVDIAADVVQVDEANLTGNPEDGPWVAAALNHIFDAVPKAAALHLCFGNYGGQTIQRGHWGRMLEFVNACHVDHVILEMTRRGPDELACLKDLRREIGIGLGMVDVKSTVVETPEDIARAIEAATKVLGPDRIQYVHPDCGLWMLKRSIADAKLAALVKGRNLWAGK